MSSGFISAGSSKETKFESDEWTKARQQVEASRQVKPSDEGKQEGGKSLFEHLQANKAAKQDAFEEANKLRNQFRPLDDSEVEFLESVQQKEREQEATVRKETQEQLEAFRKERAAAERTAQEGTEQDFGSGDTEKAGATESWSTSKKRRREHPSDKLPGSKLRRTSTNEVTESKPETLESSKPSSTKQAVDTPSKPTHESPKPEHENTNRSTETTTTSTTGLGLDAYGSDEDDD